MTAALQRGEGNMLTEKGPRRVQPTKALMKSTRDGGLDSAPTPNNQAHELQTAWQSRNAFGVGSVVLATTIEDDPEARRRLKAAGARGGHTLKQMGQVLRHWGLKHPPVELQEAWLRIGIAQYVAIRASRPRWTLGLHNWVRRYLPEIWRTWPAERVDAMARKMRRDGTCFLQEEKGAMLGIDRETYLALKLSDIWPAGMTPEEREHDQRIARNARDRANNLATERVKSPHDQSNARKKPWKDLGISERTYYRHLKLGKLPQAA